MYSIIGYSQTSQNLRSTLQEGACLATTTVPRRPPQTAISSNGFYYQHAGYHGRYAKNYSGVRKSDWQVRWDSASPHNVGEDIFLQRNNAPPHHSLALLEEEEGLIILD